MIRRFKEFPEIARSSAAAYETEVATYDTIPLPLPTPEERDDCLLALADTREKKLHYLQARNDLEFALQNPDFFDEMPPSDVLTGAVSVYTKLINAAMAHAVRLSRGEITPPQIFDPATASLAEPAPVPLKKKRTEGLTVIASPMSAANFPKLVFNVPDHCQVTTRMTVSYAESAIPAARHAGMVLAAPTGHYVGISKRVDSGGQQVGGVSGDVPGQLFPFADARPYFEETVHLSMTIRNRKMRKVEFSRDGTEWTALPAKSMSKAGVQIPEKKLFLFASSADDKPVNVKFPAPKIEALAPEG
ncbi:hypothetical protein [Acrocarpospora pleiomorpha]|uniref:hypothetical protein n=1 Tax=Acrocarpospora pleiomorpha TaxID=90975 RepID=UPI0012D311AB|nr:hypothetical protein [Acrocarpospora pleiomorpha]